MSFSLTVYNLALGAATPLLPGLALGAGLAGRWGQVSPRLGFYLDLAPARPGPRVWLQAVSVGEVAVARAVAGELLKAAPRIQLTVTSSTPKGLEAARASLGPQAAVAPFPLDVPWAVHAAARRVAPHVYASLETEIWPNLLAALAGRGADLLLLNGRLSPRSFPRYQKIRWLVEPCLRRFSLLSMIGQEDAGRVLALGADPIRVRVEGNAKYAGLLQRAREADLAGPAERLALGQAPLLVAGSVRGGEEDAVLRAFAQVREKHPNAVLALVPRHLERSRLMLAHCGILGLQALRYSELSPARPRPADVPVVVVDVMGALMAIYGLAGAAFVGASLVKKGGQNPMEPAAWGAPCCFGPSMEDFVDASAALLGADAAVTVRDYDELAAFWLECLERPALAQARGQAGRQVVARWSGAAAAAAGHILASLERQGVLR